MIAMAEELQSNFFSGFQSSNCKRTRLFSDSNQQEGDANSSGQTSPLGLRLSKTPSFVNLVEMKLTQARSNCSSPDETHIESARNTFRAKKDNKTPSLVNLVAMKLNQARSNSSSPDQTHIGSARNTFLAKKDDFENEKLKASNFPALLLKVGSWERISRHDCDLVAKCYYAKKKIVWEVLDGALKSKIEIQWSDIEAIRATIADDQSGILEIELNQPPQFFRETNPQPRKHTLWHQASDFTGGQALTYRRHYIRFPPGTLDRHYEKLLQCDHRLFVLSQRPFPRLESPYFYSNLFSGTDISFDFRAPPQSQVPSRGMQYSFPHMPYSSFLVPPQRVQSHGQAVGIVESSYSPMSVMDFPQTYDNVNRYTFDNPRAAHWGSEGNNDGNLFTGDDHIQELQPYITSAVQRDDAAFSCHLPTYWGEAAGRPDSSNLILSGLENHLLSDSLVSCSDEAKLIAQERSMCSVLEPRDVTNFSQNIAPNIIPYGRATYVHDTGINHCLEMDSAIPFVQPTRRFPPQVFVGASTMSHLPRVNNPYGFPNPTADDYDVVDANHHARQ